MKKLTDEQVLNLLKEMSEIANKIEVIRKQLEERFEQIKAETKIKVKE